MNNYSMSLGVVMMGLIKRYDLQFYASIIFRKKKICCH